MATKTRKLRAGDVTKAVAYVRASTSKQEESPAVQLSAILAWAEAHGVQIVAQHADVGVSGTVEGTDRPGMIQALASMREHGAGRLCVQRRDRLGRDLAVVAILERAVERIGGQVVAVDMGAVDGISGMVLRGTLDLLASVERALISERTRGALQAKRARGERVGQIGLGYRLAGDGTRLEAHGAESVALAEARRLRARGQSWRQVAASLESKHPRGRGLRWHARSLSRVVRDTPDGVSRASRAA